MSKDFPLIQAIQNHDPQKVDILLRQGANPDAILNRDPSLNIVQHAQQRLLETIARAQGKWSFTTSFLYPMRVMVFASYESMDTSILMSILNSLLSHGADINGYDGLGNTALLNAENQGRTPIIDLLLTRGADVNHANKSNYTALYLAATASHMEAVQRILQSNPDADMQTDFGTSALMAACYSRSRLPLVRMLIEAGANPHLTGSQGRNALAIAKEYQHLEIVAFLGPLITQRLGHSMITGVKDVEEIL